MIDELHLFLRISDVLFENLFAELQRLSHRSKTLRNGDPTDHVERAVSAIRKSGFPSMCGCLKKVLDNPGLVWK